MFVATLVALHGCSSSQGQHGGEERDSNTPSQGGEGTAIRLGAGLATEVPDNWVRQQPRLRMIEHEFSVPSVEGDDRDGRVTVMIAGGGVEANLDRWYGQFTQPDGSSTEDKATVEKVTIDGREAVMVDISGTYEESMGGGPFAPGKKVQRENYRMLGAIVPTHAGIYFIKFTGPAATVEKNAEGFRNMVKGLRKAA